MDLSVLAEARLTTAEREELRQLRKENAELKRANQILKAASFLAQEMCATKRDVDREAVKDRIRQAVAAAW